MYLGVEPKNRGILPPKWMVKIRENPIRIDDLGGNTPIFGNTHFLFNKCDFPANYVSLPECKELSVSPFTSDKLWDMKVYWPTISQFTMDLGAGKKSPQKCPESDVTLPPTIMEVENGPLQD